MIVKNGIKLYTSSEVGAMVGRTKPTVVRWDKCSEMAVALGNLRFIPAPIRVNGSEWRYWTEFDLRLMVNFASNLTSNILIETEREYKKMLIRGTL